MKTQALNLSSITKKSLNFNTDKQAFIKVKIIPKSHKNEIIEIMEDGCIKLKIKEIAEKGKANLELIKFLKKELCVRKVDIISGKTDRSKLIRLTKT